MGTLGRESKHATPFRRHVDSAEERYRYIGDGDFGGKALGLAFMEDVLKEEWVDSEFPKVEMAIPRLLVLRSSVFEQFIKFNKLDELLVDPPSDERIGRAFQRASFPARHIGDLMALAESLRGPLAVRSSSRLEDAMFQPFAGVYATKMIPNNQSDGTVRFQKLMEAIKFVWASTWFKEARQYHERAGVDTREESMAVIIQEVAGDRYHERFYPTMSGVGRSFNYYAFGRAKPEQGVVDLALGLGKHIVDGGLVWTYSPAWPKLPPPYGEVRDLLKTTQTRFWAVNLGRIPSYDPLREVEYLVLSDLEIAEADGALNHLASTYDAQSDRLLPGIGRDGPRVVDFGPLLQFNVFPINPVIKKLLELCESRVGQAVEIEFAATLPKSSNGRAEFRFLQVRPMVTFEEEIDLTPRDEKGDTLLAISDHVLGNGRIDELTDIIYVRPEKFEPKHTEKIAGEVEQLNLQLLREKKLCLLIGFGRWGSTDPWLGIPVVWSQISTAKVIVEVTTPEMDVDLSQGSHFFHNLSAFQVSYFSVKHTGQQQVDFDWLDQQPAQTETEFVRHVQLAHPLNIKVDGRSARGVIHHA